MRHMGVTLSGVLIFGFGLLLILILALGGLQYVTAPFRGEVDERERIEADGGFRIAAYEEFQSLCGDIEALNGQIANDEELLADTSSEGAADNIALGLAAKENERLALISEYNTKAASDETRGSFRDADLPPRITNDDRSLTCGN